MLNISRVKYIKQEKHCGATLHQRHVTLKRCSSSSSSVDDTARMERMGG